MGNKEGRSVGLSGLNKGGFKGETINVSNLNNLIEAQEGKGEIEEAIKKVRGNYNTIPRLKRKTLKLKIDEGIYQKFLERRFDLYFQNSDKGNMSNANFLKLIIKNIQVLFLEKYGEIEEVLEDDILFLKSAGRKVNLHQFYNFDPKNSISTSMTLEVEVIEYFYRLAMTYFLKERKSLQQYSLALFFYDIMEMIEVEELKLKFYDKTEIDNFVNDLVSN